MRTVGLPGALAMALKRRGRWFDPALADALLSIRDDRRFWGPFDDPRMVPAVAAWEPTDGVRTARILAVADIFEALTADRPYREAMPHGRALEIVREQRGSGLCPAAFDALEAAATPPPWTADLVASADDGRVRPPLRRPA